MKARLLKRIGGRVIIEGELDVCGIAFATYSQQPVYTGVKYKLKVLEKGGWVNWGNFKIVAAVEGENKEQIVYLIT